MNLFPFVVIGILALAACAFAVMNWRRREPKPMMSESCRWVSLLSIPGVFAFLAGTGVLVANAGKFQTLGFALFFGGLLVVLASIVVNSLTAKARRAAWPVVQARCVQRTLDKHSSAESNDVWAWRLVCEFEIAEKKYRVNPRVRWSDAAQSESPFWSEAKAKAFMEEAIVPSGQCRLRVNPKNPHEAELLG